MKYLLDTNILISAKNLYYHPEFHPGYWNFLKLDITSGNFLLIDHVFEEISEGNDYLTQWVKPLKDLVFSTARKDILINSFQVAEYIRETKRYVKKIDPFLEGADTWLVATAMIGKDFVIVTDEDPDLDDSSHSPKIPSVSRHFKCRSIGPFEFLREMKPRFLLDPGFRM